MASSGTVGNPTIFTRYKPHDLRQGVVIVGKMRIKNQAVLEAGVLGLNTIEAAFLQQYATPDAVGASVQMYGSVTTPGSLMNNLQINSYKGSQNPTTGTTHIGTIAGGTQQCSFQIFGR